MWPPHRSRQADYALRPAPCTPRPVPPAPHRFQPVDYSSVDIGKLFRSAAFFLNGVTPTEMNPKFAEQVGATSEPPGARCCRGGTVAAQFIHAPAPPAQRTVHAHDRGRHHATTPS